MNDLIKGKEVLTPKYDFSTHSRIGEEVVYPSEYIILEGTLLGADRKLMELASCRIFCDTDIDICLLRRIDRDIRERGRDIVSIFQQYETQVKQAVLCFEPRITRNQLSIRIVTPEDSGNIRAISFEIDGELWAQPLPDHLFVKTEVDLETGHHKLKGESSG